MITIDDIKKALSSHAIENNYFIVDVLINNGNKIIIYVDNMSHLTIGECGKINRWIRNQFEEELEDYELIVSTPGLDQPIKTQEQFKKNIDNEVEIIALNGKKETGILKSYDQNKFSVEFEKKIKNDKGKKETIIETQEFQLKDIKSVKIVIKI
jgi:ribosome maturation factor RimP